MPNTANKNETESGSADMPMVDRPSTVPGDVSSSEAPSAGADKTVVEVPGKKGSEGTVVVFVSTEQGGAGSKKSSLLVTIPLKSQRAP